MFKGLVAKIKGVLQKMGIINEIQSITDLEGIPATDAFYMYIENVWLPLYQGELMNYKDEPFHEIEYTTIGGGKKTRRMKSLNMPKTASEEMARLIFNERCKINISDDTTAASIQSVLADNNFYKMFQDHLEYMFALGGMVMKVYPQTDRLEQKKVKISFVTADCFIPLSYSNGRIEEGVFLSTFKKGDNYYTLLEWNRWDGPKFVVRNELFQSSDESTLGTRVPLSTIYDNLQREVVYSKLTRPTFIYTKPNIANNIDLQSPLGISLFANAIDDLLILDTIYDSFLREFRLGKKRIIVPSTAISYVIDPITGERHRYFDANDEAYVAMSFKDVDNQKIVDTSVELRVDEHAKALQTQLDVVSMKLGFSAGTFTFDGQGLKTATEVVSENSKTYKSKNSHETIIEESLKELVTTICEVAETHKIFTPAKDYVVTIDFDDSIVEDRDSDSNFWLKLQNNGNIPKWYALQYILKIPPEEAKELIKETQEEQADEMPDIDTQFGGGA
ncbi:phage portal protein [Bacillus paralicheniformis]|uniref:phage portal protein n=1 Tax=Bacillus paralicheniformis TaxID=1648923 RepID=UPI0039823955